MPGVKFTKSWMPVMPAMSRCSDGVGRDGDRHVLQGLFALLGGDDQFLDLEVRVVLGHGRPGRRSPRVVRTEGAERQQRAQRGVLVDIKYPPRAETFHRPLRPRDVQEFRARGGVRRRKLLRRPVGRQCDAVAFPAGRASAF